MTKAHRITATTITIYDEDGNVHLLRNDGADGLYYDENGNGRYDEGELYWQLSPSGESWILLPIIASPEMHWFVPLPDIPPAPGEWWYEPVGIMSPKDTGKFNSFGNHVSALSSALSGVEDYDYDAAVASLLGDIYGGLEPDDPENPLDLSNYQVLVQRRAEYYPILQQIVQPTGLALFHASLLHGLSETVFVALPYENLDNNVFSTERDQDTTHLVDTDGNVVVYDIYIERTGEDVVVSGSFMGEALSPEMVEHPILVLTGVLNELMD